MNIGNSNRWFDTYNSAVAYYDNLISNYGSKLRAEEITIEEYDKNAHAVMNMELSLLWQMDCKFYYR